MMATTDKPDHRQLLTFEEFRTLVDRKEWRVRAALLALRITAIPEGRRTFYEASWAERVQRWIDTGKAE